MEESGCSLSRALAELDRVAPDAPILALGQTVFWDEPMKAGVLLGLQRLGSNRRFVAGVHDTDYFAKLPRGPRRPGKFQALPHNDTSTKGLWSAAAEFSTLFGSETVITRESLLHAGLKVARLEAQKPGFLEEATEAWGWRGVVSLDEHAPITKDVKLYQVFDALHQTLEWALSSALEGMTPASQAAAEPVYAELKAMLCDAADDRTISLAELYESILPRMYTAVSGRVLEFETTRTTQLLKLNRKTASLPRFQFAHHFISESSRETACRLYDQAITDHSLGSSGFYELSRFGSGAIPFDLVIPSVGRGTVRIGRRGVVIMTPTPQFLSLRAPLQSIEEFAELVEDKFGPNCTLIGKAVSLIGMLSREFVFAFHDGGSMYVKRSALLHRLMNEAGLEVIANPILRIKYETWDALSVACTWFKLPPLLQRPFGSEELCAPSFARRWREVGEEQSQLLEVLGSLRRPIDLIEFLDGRIGGSWRRIAEEYRAVHDALVERREAIEAVRAERIELYRELGRARVALVEAERISGEHFRQEIFEREPSDVALERRRLLQEAVADAHHHLRRTKEAVRSAMRRQAQEAAHMKYEPAIRRRNEIETEAELKRLRLIREAVLASKGLENASRRPSAWWFPLVSPDGLWFRETVESADYCLESLQ